MIDDFVRRQIRPLLKDNGFGADHLTYRRPGDGVSQLVCFDHPYGPDTLRVNAYVAVPALIHYDIRRYGFSPDAKPSRANSHMQTTLGGSPGTIWPMVWQVDPARVDEIGEQMRQAMTMDVLPWLDALRSERAVLDAWMSVPWRTWRPASLEHLIVLLERNGSAADLTEAKAVLSHAAQAK
ncbi:MAG: DUF4304 domain-containing protein [Chloroflexota bacterium]